MGKIFDKTLAPSESVYDGKMLDPREIRISPEFNGRHDLPPINDLLKDFQNSAIGQIQPVLVTKDDDGAPMLLAGHRRWRAAIELTKQGKGPSVYGGVYRLKCQYYKGTPQDCFVMTVKENLSRVDTVPVDDGWNISRMRTSFHMSYEDIATNVYGRTTADGKPDVKWVKEREALTELAKEAAEAVTAGHVKPNAISVLAALSKTAQRDLLKSQNGKVITVAVVKRAAAPVGVNGTSEAHPKPPASRKWDKQAVCAKLQEWIDLELPPHIAKMDPENAIRTVLSQIQEEINCGGC